jgi:nicotinamidase-related amidase
MRSAFIIVDIQNDYFKGGKNELNQPEQAASNAKRVLDHYRKKGLPVYHVQHISNREGATFFLPGTEGAEIHKIVKPQPGEKVFVKHTPNSFFDTGLADELTDHHIDHITVCGMMSHMCIDTTVRAAAGLGLIVTVIHDACTTKDLIWQTEAIPAGTVHGAFMAAMQGLFANVVSTQEFLKTQDHHHVQEGGS